MTHPIIGWESENPVPDGHQFNDYLRAENGRLHLQNLDLADLFLREANRDGDPFTSPLEIVYLPLIRRQIHKMQRIFAEVSTEVGYEGQFHYTYASKANAAEEVIRTTLGAGAHHEMSSTVDVDIAKIMIQRGLLPPDRFIISNGFKPEGSHYARNLLTLKPLHDKLIPVIEDLGELATFLGSSHKFDVGLRQKSYGPQTTEAEMDAANSRFGVDMEMIWKTADYIAAAPNLTLKLYHFMVGSQLTDIEAFISYLKPGMEIYARLRQRHPSLSIFNFGGGMPVAMTLDFDFDYHEFVRQLLTALQEVCGRYGVPVPDVMGEFGRYTTSEHGAHLFKIITVKENSSKLPWYIIDGSIMSSFPDSWALSEHFILLPLNNLDKPFQQVQLGGITCDSDDVYPPKPSHSPLYLPTDTDELYVGFFSIGAYQEMLGGVGGSKHCVIPEAVELIVNVDENGDTIFETLQGQTAVTVLRNLGYNPG
ncbi:MAG: arginine decarboxylase [Ardenticatenaceae bacterium]|nr:arginine decarboxylase [Ardenticatenaceae bacterium]